jgi:glutamate-1-semialdehyde aminotransferase
MKPIFSSPNSAELGLLKSRLEAEGIPCGIRNEQTSQVIPTEAFSAELCVLRDEDHERAVELCEAWQRPPAGFREPWVCRQCGERLEGQFTECWKCGSSREPELPV